MQRKFFPIDYGGEPMKSIARFLVIALYPLRLIKKSRDLSKRKNELKRLSCQPIKKIIAGSAGTQFKGWISTDRDVLNVLDQRAWRSYFTVNSLDAILAEHVWEHLTPQEAAIAATHCFRYLKHGGYLRVAVPDGYHPDPDYIEWVKPGGNGPGSDDHKVLYTFDTFKEVFSSAGFDVYLYEYFDEQGVFHELDWDPENGMVQRSRRFDDRNADGNLRYTSIIADALKPIDRRD